MKKILLLSLISLFLFNLLASYGVSRAAREYMKITIEKMEFNSGLEDSLFTVEK